MIGHGWQLVEAAPDGDAGPTLFAPSALEAPSATRRLGEPAEAPWRPQAPVAARRLERVREALRSLPPRALGERYAAAPPGRR